MSGAGNDFILIDKAGNSGIVLTNGDIQQLCDRRNGIGADGIILFGNEDGYDFSMEYFNADGSTGTLCGNGARCAIKYAKIKGILGRNKTDFISNKTTYSGELLKNGLVRFDLNPPDKIVEKLKVKFSGYEVNAGYVNTGSPHVVIDINDLKEEYPGIDGSNNGLQNFPVVQFGREIRFNSAFKPKGINVNFIELEGGIVRIRTYERGVEEETLSCGTGSVASAIIAYLKYNLKTPIRLITKGSEELIVDFNSEDFVFSNITLTGPAKEVFSGEILV